MGLPDGRLLLRVADVATARARIRKMLDGFPVTEEDLDDDAPYVLVPARMAGDAPLRYGVWRHAESWADLGLPVPPDPA
ncbi:MAG: hypothetical protein ABFS86_10655 [Planctomycetota bacterium]